MPPPGPRWLVPKTSSGNRPDLIPSWDRPDRIFPRGRASFVPATRAPPRHNPASSAVSHHPSRRRSCVLSPRPIAFSPDFAASRRPLLWSGEGVGAGTLVATPDGPVPAERLQRGGTVLGESGRALMLTEVHHVALPAAAFRRLGLAPPVRIAAGALGFGMPAAPLLLGPAQCVRLDGGWIAADLLVDGWEIRHLDDDARMVLLALGDDASLLAAGVMLAPASSTAAPRLASDAAPTVATLRRLAGAAPTGALAGYVEHADRAGVTGWALDCAAPDRVVALEVVVGGRVVAQFPADLPRRDLPSSDSTQQGSIRHGFAWRFAPNLPAGRAWLVEVRRAGGGASLSGTPLLLDAATATPAAFDIALAGLGEAVGLGAAGGDMHFLAQLIENAANARPR